MELIKVGEKTYYLKNPTNIGIYKLDEENVIIIDSGNDKDAGKKILKILENEHLKLKTIINTHSHADHIGGNKLLQDRTNCQILAHKTEKSITENPLFEPSILYGAYPLKDLQNKFLLAKPSTVCELENNLPEGITYFLERGHCFDMVGIKTSDDIYFLGDALFDEKTLAKYKISYIYDIEEFLNTLDYLETLKGNLFIISHGEPLKDIKNLIELNRKTVLEIADIIYDIVQEKTTLEDIIQIIFNKFNITMNINQYYLLGSTIKSYLTYLFDKQKITYEFNNNKMYWCQVK